MMLLSNGEKAQSGPGDPVIDCGNRPWRGRGEPIAASGGHLRHRRAGWQARPAGSHRLTSAGVEDGSTEARQSALAPPIPSFASLRRGGRRSPADLLLSRQPETVQPVPPSTRAGGARPPEWADLWRLGLRVARWCAQQPIAAVRRLTG